MFATQTQCNATRDQYGKPRTRLQEFANNRRSANQLFEVVEHEQMTLISQEVKQSFPRWRSTDINHAEGLQDCGRNQRWVSDRRQAGEDNAVWPIVDEFRRDGHRESRLADAGWAGEGE
jgi:hypothetical protein